MGEFHDTQVSVIVPFYNPTTDILRTIRSIQKFFQNINYEIILVNDGSTNNLIKIHSKNVKVIVQDHLGVSHARNNGVRNANGRYIMFCDSDDILTGTLPSQRFDQDIVSFSINCKRECNILKNDDSSKFLLIKNLFGFNNKDDNFTGYYGGSVSKLFRKDFLIENKIIFDEKLDNSEDILFNIKAINLAKSIKLLSQGIYIYQKRLTSVTHSFDDGLLNNHIYFIKRTKKELRRYNNNAIIEKIESLYLYQLIYRYFIYKSPKIYKQEYSQWCSEICNSSSQNWNFKLNRNIEKITILLINHLGLSVAIYLARAYTYAKEKIKKSQENSLLL